MLTDIAPPAPVSPTELDTDLFRAPAEHLWHPVGARAVFGGQVAGQALCAAQRTVEAPLSVHSMHSYFILPGRAADPIIYQVKRLRDGRYNALSWGEGLMEDTRPVEV
jgi:acyl-CoA thioesterase II